MRNAAKYNISNVVPSPDDLDWANKFLYPDLREPYRLIPNKSGHKTAVELVAAARAADRMAREDVKKETKPAQPSEAEINAAFEESNKALDEFSSLIDKVFKPFQKFGSGTFTSFTKKTKR